MANDRMFRVIVLGGIGLVACGGSVTTVAPEDAGDASASTGGFPSELPTFVDGSVEAGALVDVFPSELPPIPDAGARDAGPDTFPAEGPPPPPPDASTTVDASVDGAFPVEAPK